MKASRAVQLTSREGANFSNLPSLIADQFALARPTALKLFHSSIGREYGQIMYIFVYIFVTTALERSLTKASAMCDALLLAKPTGLDWQSWVRSLRRSPHQDHRYDHRHDHHDRHHQPDRHHHGVIWDWFSTFQSNQSHTRFHNSQF